MASLPVEPTNKRIQKPIESLYDLADELGRGSFSVVKVGIERATGKRYAVKVIGKSSNNRKDTALIENELMCWSLLDHPHVVVMKEVYDTASSYCIVQELVTGGELFDKIVERSHYSEKDAANLTMQIVQAVNHMHERGVIHRDLKPENLLLSDRTENAIIKLADFGLAALANDTKRLHKAVGTPGYIAPEVLFTLEDATIVYGKEVDIWSIGVIMYILLCGFPPFYGEDDETSFELTMAGAYSFPENSCWPSISEEAKDLIRKILVVNPEERWTVDQIVNHPWMKNNTVNHLSATVNELKKFNARKKWKAAISATVAVARFRKGFGMGPGKITQLFRQQQQQL